MSRVLVTGVPGWLSSQLVRALTDGLPDGIEPPRKVEPRVLVLPGTADDELAGLDIPIYRADLRSPESLDDAFRGVEVVFHTAGIIHPRRTREFEEINARGTANALAAAIRAGCRRFVHISSNSPFGFNPSPLEPFDEESAYQPYLGYGRSKLEAERSVWAAGAANEIETVILRPCWFYGPGQPPRQTTFFKMIQKGDPIVFGSGLSLRSMSYVDNTVRAMLLAMDSESARGQAYWIADARPYRVLEIYWTVADILGVELRPRHLPSSVSRACRLGDRILQRVGAYVKEIHVAGEMDQNIVCDIGKAQRELGYEPKIELREGMRRSIEWCKSRGYL